MKNPFRLFWMLYVTLALAACNANLPVPGPISFDKSAVPRCDARLPPCAQNSNAGNPDNCTVAVEVELDGDGNCTFNEPAKEMFLEFRPRDQGRFVRWELTNSPGYSFTGDGIFIPGNRGRDFDGFQLCPGGQQFLVRNRNVRSLKAPYSIRVIKEATGEQCELDPYIRNLR